LFLHPTNNRDITLLDYRSNRVKKLNQKKSEAINSFIQRADDDISRVFIYRRDSTLTFHVSEQRKLVLHLTESDFKVTGKTIFAPDKKPFLMGGIPGIHLGLFAGAFLLFATSIGLFYSTYRLRIVAKGMPKSLYDLKEIELIRAMINHPEHTLSADEVNVLLGTSKKSLDVQRKTRSDMIISINHKYQEKTRHGDALITKVRSDSDKRLVNYFISPEKFELIKEVLPLDL
jgi:hypothetical protein